MTVSTTSAKVTVQGTGAQTVFNYGFTLPAASGFALYLTDTVALTITKLPSTVYSVSGVGSPNGGTFTYPLSGSPIPSTQFLTFARVTPQQQNTDLANQGAYYPQVVEAGFDVAMLLIQELQEQVSRCLAVPQSDSNPALLPIAAGRLNTYLAFDGTGSPYARPIGT